MQEKRIVSRDNPAFKHWKKIARHASRARRKEGLILLEGLHLVAAWQAAGGRLETLLLSEHGRTHPEIAAWLAQQDENVQCVCLPDPLFAELADTQTPAGILAIVSPPCPEGGPEMDVDTLALDGIQDPGNLGSLLRVAAAAGFGQVLLSPGCADAWTPKALRAGQGAHFQLAIHPDADLPAFLRAFAGETLATTLAEATPLHTAAWPPQSALAWVFGSE
ncbi:MAG: RNA methyltransferase, partial [Zoogloeaceae bacterium]|nr:RNA methyltransferase [Zoogloeaceae bacterium]